MSRDHYVEDHPQEASAHALIAIDEKLDDLNATGATIGVALVSIASSLDGSSLKAERARIRDLLEYELLTEGVPNTQWNAAIRRAIEVVGK